MHTYIHISINKLIHQLKKYKKIIFSKKCNNNNYLFFLYALDLLVWNNSLASELAEVEYVLYVWPHVVYNGILFLFCFILGAR